MKNISISIVLTLFSLISLAGNVTIIITEIPENTPPGDNIYIAGSFNNWDPGNPDYILYENLQGNPQIDLEGYGTIEFKFTRGNWQTIEGNENGRFLPNRSFTFGTADTLELTIWNYF